MSAALVQPLARLLSGYSWTADLLCHFQEPGVAVTAAAVVVTCRRRRTLAVLLVLLVAWQAAPLLCGAGTNPVSPAPGSTERLRVLVANVLSSNTDYERVSALIRAEKPDVVALVEYSAEWRDALKALRADYPYRIEYAPWGDPGGAALWSRRPIVARHGGPEWLVPQGNCMIRADLEFAGGTRHVCVVHPTSPFYRVGKPGNAEMSAIAVRVRAEGGSCVVAGDMNCTDRSANFENFLCVTGLRDSRLGFGRQATWPTFSPYRIAIDHVFVSDDLAVVERRVGPAIGSDHFPVIVHLAPAAAKAVAQAASSPRSRR